MIKGSILQEDTIFNVCVSNNRTSEKKNTTSNYMRQRLIELKGGIDELSVTIGDFNISLSEVDRYSIQEIRTSVISKPSVN